MNPCPLRRINSVTRLLIRSVFRSPEQANFHKIIASHIAKHDAPLLLEGTTGIGKTRAYLSAVMAAASGKKIAIALPSHQLIDQLLASTDLAATKQNGVRVAAFRPRRWFETISEYQTQKGLALDAEVMVCTSASVIIDQRLRGEYNGVTLRDYILFDEADQLPDAAALQSDCEITGKQLKELGIVAKNAQQAANAVLKKKGIEAEVKAAALMILEAIEEPAWFHQAGVTDDGGIMLYHKLPGRLLKRIANRSEVAFVSATLSISDRFDDFKRALGIQKQSDLSEIVEPSNHGKVAFQVANVEVNTPEWLDLNKKTIEKAALSGRVLVATPSNELAATLGALIPGAIVRTAETTAQAAARIGDSNVLIAAGAWAGLDTPIQWDSIVIPRIPYERPIVLDGHIESSFLDTRNTAVRRLRQVIGRGLRNAQAVCKVHILDSRYKNVESFVPRRFRAAWQEKVFLEGGRRPEFTLSKLERDPAVRKKALQHYGLKCMACDFVPKVASQLDVHHLNPLAQGGERLTSIADVAVLCANCHRLAHSTTQPIPVATLRSLHGN